MLTPLVVGLIAGLLSFVWWRSRIDRAERLLREFRETISGEIEYSVADADAARLLDFGASSRAKFEECGCTHLGDLVMKRVGGPAFAAMRAYVDPAQTTGAYILVAMRGGHAVSILFESYEEDAEYMTTTGGAAAALPPTSHCQVVDPSLPYAEMLERHRAFAGIADPTKTHARLTSLEALQRELAKNHERTVKWRASVPDDVLLDADLRLMLGKAYAKHGAAWAKRLGARLPKATLRR